MNKLLTALKGMNKFGLALVLAAVTLVATQSAFTGKKVLQQHIYGLSSDGQTYAKISDNGQLPMDGTCVSEPLYEDCYVSFADGDDPNAAFPASAIPAGAERSGTDGFWDN